MNIDRCTVVVIMPPWPRGGSASLFEASVAAYAAMGCDVHVLLAPDNPDNNAREEDHRFVLERMNFPAAQTASFLVPPGPRMAWLERRLHRLRGRNRTAIDFWSASIASRRLPSTLDAVLDQRHLAILHVHHCWNLALARRMATSVARRTGQRPRIICETHDVQSSNKDVIEGSLWLNPKTKVTALVDAENRACRQADGLLHISATDALIFGERLPTARHAVLEPTISPFTEERLKHLRGRAPKSGGALVYLATNNHWNIATAIWLVEEVIPRRPRLRNHVRIFGEIRHGIERVRPDLLKENADLFAGPVDSVLDAYTGASGILVPALGGTGSSIKLLEGLCTGLPMLGTSGVLRGLDPCLAARLPIGVEDAAEGFAKAALDMVDGHGAASETAIIFDGYFSNEVYRRRFRAAVSLDAPPGSLSAHTRYETA